MRERTCPQPFSREYFLRPARRVVASILGLILLIPCITHAATPDDNFIPFGREGLDIPPRVYFNSISPRTVDLLGDALQHQSGGNRVRLIQDLGRCMSSALKYLLPALSDPDPAIRAEAARAVGNFADPSLAPKLRPLLNDLDPSVRREAVLSAAALGDAQAVGTALEDADEGVRLAAIRSASTGDHAARIAQLLPNLSLRLQGFAADAIGRIGAGHADALLPLLKSDAPCRTAAIQALGQMKATGHLDVVLAAVKDPHPRVRRTAITALALLAPPATQQQTAIAALADPDDGVRTGAADVLAHVPTEAAMTPLFQQLPSDDLPLHDAARAALAAIGPPVISTAAKMLDDADPRARRDGSYLLGALSSKENLRRHMDLLDDSDWTVVRQAALSLYQIVPPADPTGPKLMNILDRIDKLDPKKPLPHEQAFALSEAVPAVFILAGRIHYGPIAGPAMPLLPPPKPMDPMQKPDAWRCAAIWAIGMTADPHSGIAGTIMQMLSENSGQTAPAMFEAIKAMGNMKKTEAIPLLKDYQSPHSFTAESSDRWMAHYVYDRLTGTTTPYVPPQPTPREPDVSVRSLKG